MSIAFRKESTLPAYFWPDPSQKKRCARCLYPEDIPGIRFNDQGICDYCLLHDQMDQEYPVGEEGEKYLRMLASQIRKEGTRKKYDCLVGVSGGCDSSFLLFKAKELGLRPLAVHYDNTWDSTIAVENIHNMLRKLNVELFTHVVDNKEMDDIFLSFLKAGVSDLEAPTDIALAATLYRVAAKYGVKTILEGHSFRTEGISPLGWLYMDGKYIKTLHQQFGKLKMKTFPNMPLTSFLKWLVVDRIKKVRPLYYMDYRKEETKKFLADQFGWQWYGGHHLENRFTAFFHSYFFPRRWGIDGRLLGYSALIRSGQMTREEGMRLIQNPPEYDPEIVELVKKRFALSDADFEYYMTMPKKSFRDFKTYKKTFERLRPLFWLLYKGNLIPKSFYIKFAATMS